MLIRDKSVIELVEASLSVLWNKAGTCIRRHPFHDFRVHMLPFQRRRDYSTSSDGAGEEHVPKADNICLSRSYQSPVPW